MRRVNAKKVIQKAGSVFILFCRERDAMALVMGMPVYGRQVIGKPIHTEVLRVPILGLRKKQL